MKRIYVYVMAVSLLCAGCGTSQNAGAILTGASVGGNLGGAIGSLAGSNHRGWHGNYRGSAIGTIIGTVAGAAIGGAVSSSRQKERDMYDVPIENTYVPAAPRYETYSTNVENLRIRRIRFIDDDRNHIISSGENSEVIFEIMNESNETAYNVVPTVSSDQKKLNISPSVLIEQIPPHTGIKYTAFIKAGRKIKDGTVTIRIAVTDDRGQEYDNQSFTLPTRR